MGFGKLNFILTLALLTHLNGNGCGKVKKHSPGRNFVGGVFESSWYSAYRLAKDTSIPQTRVSEIIKGRRRVTTDTALRFSKYSGTTPKFWLGLQDHFDLEEEQQSIFHELNNIKTLEVDEV